jgi:uncharacterized membrane protein YczE
MMGLRYILVALMSKIGADFGDFKIYLEIVLVGCAVVTLGLDPRVFQDGLANERTLGAARG